MSLAPGYKKMLELVDRYTNHVPDPQTIQAMADIRVKVRDLALLIETLCPESREKATALTQLSFVMMSANSAIVQKCPVNQDELAESSPEFLEALNKSKEDSVNYG